MTVLISTARNRNRRPLKCFCISALVLALIGCGGGSAGGGESPDPEPVMPTPPNPPVSNLPPDPGDAGLATVEGIDSDSDGVRDDVQRYIALTYPSSETVRAALSQIAVALQDQLTSDSSNDAVTAAGETMRATECLFAVTPGGSESERLGTAQRLQAVVMNSQIRLDAYRLFDQQLWGEVIESVGPDQGQASCVFNPDSLSD